MTVQVVCGAAVRLSVVMTAMANFDPVYLEAAHMSVRRAVVRAFLEVELPRFTTGSRARPSSP